MKHSLNIKQFYKELGRLLYAVAMADKKIQPKEVQALREFVSRELASSELTSDSSGMNQAFYTSFEFDDYARQHISIKKALNSFIKFLDANIMEIDPVLIDKSIQAIEKVASSFRRINEQERIMIDSIKKQIKEIAEIY